MNSKVERRCLHMFVLYVCGVCFAVSVSHTGRNGIAIYAVLIIIVVVDVISNRTYSCISLTYSFAINSIAYFGHSPFAFISSFSFSFISSALSTHPHLVIISSIAY